MTTDTTPNPGSQEARDQGCLCPRMDNCGGRFAPIPPDGWYIREDCPLHSPSQTTGEEGR